MPKPSKHVVPSASGRWALKNAGAVRASATFDTQQQAIERGRAAAQKARTDLYVHSRDGSVHDKMSYGNDPLQPQERELQR